MKLMAPILEDESSLHQVNSSTFLLIYNNTLLKKKYLSGN